VTLAVIVCGGLVETLQAAPLLSLLAADAKDPVLLACPPEASCLAAGLASDIDELTLGALDWRRPAGTALLAAAARLRRRRVDAALVCGEQPRARLLVYAAGIARRTGAAGGPLAFLLTDRVAALPGENRAATWLRLAGSDGSPVAAARGTFDPGAGARRLAEDRLLGRGFENGRLLVAMAPGPGFMEPPPGVPDEDVLWAPERFAHLANLLNMRHGAGMVVLGTAGDRPVVDRVLLDLAAPVLDLCGEVDLVGAAAVIERCDLLVSGDGPLLHLAACTGTPSIGLFGPSDGRRRGPYGPEHRVVQGLSERDPPVAAMSRIRVDDVLAGIEAAM